MLRGIFRKRRHLLDHSSAPPSNPSATGCDWMRLQLDQPEGKLAARPPMNPPPDFKFPISSVQ
jgi:hypothetical protein